VNKTNRKQRGENWDTHCSSWKWCISFQFSTNLYGRALWNFIALAVYSKCKYRNTSLRPLFLTWFVRWQTPPVSGRFPKFTAQNESFFVEGWHR